jgi:hypothetical protein
LAEADFHIYYDAAERLKTKKPLYQLKPFNGYVYSPFLALVLNPVTRLPVERAAKLWFYVSCAGAIVAVALYSLAVGFPIIDVAKTGMVLLLVFNAMPVSGDLNIGQADLLLLLVVAAIYLAETYSGYNSIALLIVLGALIKTWVLGIALFLVLRRRWRAACVCCAVYLASLCALFSIIGWREFPSFVHVTRAYSVQPQLVMYSIAGFARLQFSKSNITQAVLLGRIPYWAFVSTADLLVLLGLVSIFRARVSVDRYRRRLQLGLTILAVLLLLPMCQAEYFALCLPLLADLMISDRPDRPYRQGVTSVVAVLSYLVYTRSWPRFPPIPSQFQTFPRSLEVSAYFFAFVAVGAAAYCNIFKVCGQLRNGDHTKAVPA